MPTSSAGKTSAGRDRPNRDRANRHVTSRDRTLRHATSRDRTLRHVTSRDRTSRDREGAVNLRSSGVTLIEMLVVVALISLMIGISYPALTSGIDSLRLNAATNGVVSFLDYGLSRAERRQQMVEITISKADNSVEMRSSEPGFYRKLELPEGVSIVRVFPDLPENPDPDAKRDFVLYPGGTVPALGLQLINRRNVQRVVRVDPITGVPHVEAPEQ